MTNPQEEFANNKDSMVNDNQVASEKNEQSGEAEIISYDKLFPNHEAQDDLPEVSSTDDV